MTSSDICCSAIFGVSSISRLHIIIMLSDRNSYSLDKDLLDIKDYVLYSHLRDLQTSTESVERISYTDDLDYIFKLIRSSFLYFQVQEGYLPLYHLDDKDFYYLSFNVLSLPFKSDANKAEVEQWNDLVRQVSSDYLKRKDEALRGHCTLEELETLVRDNLENFDYPDRKRLDAKKLVNLIVFVYDYCILTLKESRLHPYVDLYVNGDIIIRDKTYRMPLRICASVCNYEPFDMVDIGGFQWPMENYDLPRMQLKSVVRNPHVSDSVLSAIFTDLLHKFFFSFGLQRKGNSQWAKPERMLIYELLRLFGLCKSSKPAAESKYVTTVMNDYGDYFSSCNLRTWIRADQAYSYLMCCPEEEFLRRGQQINEPFISLDDYVEVQAEDNPKSGQRESQNTHIDRDIPNDIGKALNELKGQKIQITHTEYGVISFASVTREPYQQDIIEWDPKLDYVMDLVRSSFDYITFFPILPQHLVIRQDLQDPKILSKLVTSLDNDLLGRIDSIPRGRFELEKMRHLIEEFYEFLPREDRAKFNVEKFLVLSLFIFDYVFLTYKESTITPHLRKFIPSKISICDDSYESKVLVDDMLLTYVTNPFCYKRDSDPSKYYQRLRTPSLYVPEENYPIEHPACTVKNMTSMFYDLFVHFFRTMGLTKRSDVKYVSEQESNLIGELASCCGICVTDKLATARTMFMSNKDYFKNGSLSLSIRENEYGYLMLNNLSDELFGTEWPTET